MCSAHVQRTKLQLSDDVVIHFTGEKALSQDIGMESGQEGSILPVTRGPPS